MATVKAKSRPVGKPKLTLKLKVAALTVNEAKAELKNAVLVFGQTVDAANTFYELFQNSRQGSKGTSSHAEQDLLRAMLVFACSGLDAVVKQLVEDSLPAVIEKEEGAQLQFQKFVERRLKKGGDEKEKQLDAALLASLFAGKTPRNRLLDLLKRELTDDSLQSQDQLLKVAAYFAITRDQVMAVPDSTKKAFAARNQIIHEMDVDLAGKKKRRQRAVQSMVGYCENILEIARAFVATVDAKLT